MDESGAGEPDADESGNELAKADAVGRLEHVEVLQYVRDGHQTQSTCEPQTWPVNTRHIGYYSVVQVKRYSSLC